MLAHVQLSYHCQSHCIVSADPYIWYIASSFPESHLGGIFNPKSYRCRCGVGDSHTNMFIWEESGVSTRVKSFFFYERRKFRVSHSSFLLSENFDWISSSARISLPFHHIPVYILTCLRRCQLYVSLCKSGYHSSLSFNKEYTFTKLLTQVIRMSRCKPTRLLICCHFPMPEAPVYTDFWHGYTHPTLSLFVFDASGVCAQGSILSQKLMKVIVDTTVPDHKQNDVLE